MFISKYEYAIGGLGNHYYNYQMDIIENAKVSGNRKIG